MFVESVRPVLAGRFEAVLSSASVWSSSPDPLDMAGIRRDVRMLDPTA